MPDPVDPFTDPTPSKPKVRVVKAELSAAPSLGDTPKKTPPRPTPPPPPPPPPATIEEPVHVKTHIDPEIKTGFRVYKDSKGNLIRRRRRGL